MGLATFPLPSQGECWNTFLGGGRSIHLSYQGLLYCMSRSVLMKYLTLPGIPYIVQIIIPDQMQDVNSNLGATQKNCGIVGPMQMAHTRFAYSPDT